METLVRSCSKCGEMKSEDGFFRYKDRPQTECKRCIRKARQNADYHAHRAERIEKARAAYDRNPLKYCSAERKRRYGLTDETFEALKAKTSGACGVCGHVRAQMVIDHCHATNKVRGYLCGNCNRAIGMAKDDPAILRKLADYLECNR